MLLASLLGSGVRAAARTELVEFQYDSWQAREILNGVAE